MTRAIASRTAGKRRWQPGVEQERLVVHHQVLVEGEASERVPEGWVLIR
jgi:hypothetical protein